MGWLSTRTTIMTIVIVAAAILFGFGKSVGITPTSQILNTGITWAQVIAIGMIYIFFMFWKRYI